MPKRDRRAALFEELRKHALGYPEAHEDHPWGEIAIKVRGKVFVFMGKDGLSTKLPQSADAALMLPFAEPTHYGLGRSGWVTARFGPDEEPPVGMLREWIDESYRAVAPKKIVALLDGGGAEEAPAAPRRAKRPAKKK